jgi:acyl-CoA reductase-like NAD-dependent aldehyde dehydrogenase
VRSEVALRRPDPLFIDGQWVQPSTDAVFDVIEAATENLFFRVAEAREADMSQAIAAARNAFDQGPWPQLTHTQRAQYLRAIAAAVGERVDDFAQIDKIFWETKQNA